MTLAEKNPNFLNAKSSYNLKTKFLNYEFKKRLSSYNLKTKRTPKIKKKIKTRHKVKKTSL